MRMSDWVIEWMSFCPYHHGSRSARAKTMTTITARCCASWAAMARFLKAVSLSSISASRGNAMTILNIAASRFFVHETAHKRTHWEIKFMTIHAINATRLGSSVAADPGVPGGGPGSSARADTTSGRSLR